MKLLDCRSALDHYFSWCLTTAPGTSPIVLDYMPELPRHSAEHLEEVELGLQSYSITGALGNERTLLEALLKGQLLKPDWINGPNGVLALLSRRHSVNYREIDPADLYCIPSVVTRLCAFLHRLVVGRGWIHVEPPPSLESEALLGLKARGQSPGRGSKRSL